MTITRDWMINSAEVYASMYDEDDRQDIKIDVLNAFYAGFELGRQQQRESDAALFDGEADSYHVADRISNNTGDLT